MGKKRRLWMIWGIMLVMIGLVEIQTEAYGDSGNWEFFLSDAECDFYYDPGTVSRSPERIVRVWWKEVFKTKEVLRSRGFAGSEYEKVVYQINVTEINCPRKEWRRKFFMLCPGEGDDTPCAIHREQSDKWAPVMEEQPIGALYRKLCR
jgi:hypothetical protein